MPTQNYIAAQSASPYVRYWLAMGEPPLPRVHGWVQALITAGRDNLPSRELRAKYGEALRSECRAAGFEPHCDRPLAKQSAEARQAAKQWARQLLTEHTY